MTSISSKPPVRRLWEGAEGADDRAGEERHPGDPQLPGGPAGRPLPCPVPQPERGAHKMVAEYLKTSGITNRSSPHSLRLTFATCNPSLASAPSPQKAD